MDLEKFWTGLPGFIHFPFCSNVVPAHFNYNNNHDKNTKGCLQCTASCTTCYFSLCLVIQLAHFKGDGANSNCSACSVAHFLALCWLTVLPLIKCSRERIWYIRTKLPPKTLLRWREVPTRVLKAATLTQQNNDAYQDGNDGTCAQSSCRNGPDGCAVSILITGTHFHFNDRCLVQGRVPRICHGDWDVVHAGLQVHDSQTELGVVTWRDRDRQVTAALREVLEAMAVQPDAKWPPSNQAHATACCPCSAVSFLFQVLPRVLASFWSRNLLLCVRAWEKTFLCSLIC